jgi:hypothetical protein
MPGRLVAAHTGDVMVRFITTYEDLSWLAEPSDMARWSGRDPQL